MLYGVTWPLLSARAQISTRWKKTLRLGRLITIKPGGRITHHPSRRQALQELCKVGGQRVVHLEPCRSKYGTVSITQARVKSGAYTERVITDVDADADVALGVDVDVDVDADVDVSLQVPCTSTTNGGSFSWSPSSPAAASPPTTSRSRSACRKMRGRPCSACAAGRQVGK